MRFRNTQRRDGNVAAVTAACLVGLLSVVALALDGGMMLDKRRQAQAAADAAAIAAADQLYQNWWQYRGGVGNLPTATAAALAVARANGYEHGVGGCTVEVNLPPLGGQFVGMSGNVEVIISASQRRYFSRLFGSDDVPYGARAVARGRRGAIKNGIIVLAPTGPQTLNGGGNAQVNVVGAPVIVNSDSVGAIFENGGGSSGVLSASEWDTMGTGVTTGGGQILGPFVKTEPVPDPLAYLPPPDPSTLTLQSKNKTSLSGNSGTTKVLDPGVYIGGISITGQVNVKLNPGVYYMQGGGFSWGGQGSLWGEGVMIYNAPESNSDAISLAGNGDCHLTPPTSGTYQGVTLFQDRTSTTPMSIAGSGNGSMYMTGTFYCASAQLSVTGNGLNDVIGAQYISYTLVLGGNGTFNVNWTPEDTPGTREIILVE